MPVVSSLRRPLLTAYKRMLTTPRSTAAAIAVATPSACFSTRAVDPPLLHDQMSASIASSSPAGDLFHGAKDVGPSMIGQTATIRRTFGPSSNANVMLTCGGPNLAKHASFDPEYSRAQSYIRQHAIGPAVLSPILLQGLVGTLIEAAFPQSVSVTQSMGTVQPLIVGVDVQARITVTDVQQKSHDDPGYLRGKGYKMHLDTEVVRTRDNVLIAQGQQCIWIPDYLKM